MVKCGPLSPQQEARGIIDSPRGLCENGLRGYAMGSRAAFIFDLSPAEKLQLVEDLWDDLAATPEAVPIHDWQKQELARRKANLAKNPGSGLSWEEVKRSVRSRYGR